MARTNKYASLNFNDIYEKKITGTSSVGNPSSSPSSSSSASASPASKTKISNSRIHGHMLVLSRPTAKPISIPPPQPQSQPQPSPPQKSPSSFSTLSGAADQNRLESDNISLRPQGRTGSGPSISISPLPSPVNANPPSPSPKSDRFVPPHLRPGFVGREEKPGPEFVKSGAAGGRARQEHRQGGHFGASPNRYAEEARPKSGGGYERMRIVGGEADPVDVMNRPGSSGARPSSSG